MPDTQSISATNEDETRPITRAALRKLIIDCDADELNFRAKSCMRFLEKRHLVKTGWTPGTPEIQQYELPPQCRKPDRITLNAYPFKIYNRRPTL